MVGQIALRVDVYRTGEIGYWCAPGARGRGLVTRALRLVSGYALHDLGLERLQLTADARNAASQRVAEKVGFQQEGALRSHMRHPDGHRRNTIMFSLLPGELR